jgi:pimeloyl-ACP methyl ester carboxylesterase
VDTPTIRTELFVDARVPHNADGSKIECTNPPLIFVHGAMDRSTSFARLRRCFPDHITVAYDRRGYARSLGAAPATNLSDHVDDLEAILEQMASAVDIETHSHRGVGVPVVVGHSYGGVVALTLAAKRADLVRALMVFEAPMPWMDWWPSSAGASTIAAGAAGGPEVAAESFMRRIVGDEIWERLGDKTRAERKAEGLALLQDLGGLREGGSPYDVKQIKCPVVVGHGEKSQSHQQRSSQHLYSDLLAAYPHAAGRFVLGIVPGASHGAHSSDAPKFAELVRQANSLSAS